MPFTHHILYSAPPKHQHSSRHQLEIKSRPPQLKLHVPFVFSILQYIVDDGIVSEYEEDVDTHGAGYTERIAVKNHLTEPVTRHRLLITRVSRELSPW